MLLLLRIIIVCFNDYFAYSSANSRSRLSCCRCLRYLSIMMKTMALRINSPPIMKIGTSISFVSVSDPILLPSLLSCWFTKFICRPNVWWSGTHAGTVSFQASLMQINVFSAWVVSGKTWFASQFNLNKFSNRLTSRTLFGICGTIQPIASME